MTPRKLKNVLEIQIDSGDYTIKLPKVEARYRSEESQQRKFGQKDGYADAWKYWLSENIAAIK